MANCSRRQVSFRGRCIAFSVASVVWLPLVLGCGSGLASVSGTVTLDGQPIQGGSDLRGTVTFYPRESGFLPAIGLIGENGKYELSTGTEPGAKPGSYGVAIVATRIIIPEPGATPSGRPVTPRRYASNSESGLTAEVRAGNNTIDFPLSSKTN